jgi:hypothetical protein
MEVLILLAAYCVLFRSHLGPSEPAYFLLTAYYLLLTVFMAFVLIFGLAEPAHTFCLLLTVYCLLF